MTFVLEPAREAELLHGLVSRVTAMFAYWDRGLRCRFANDAYRRWFGVSPEKLIGTHIKDLLGPALFELNRPYMERALRGEPQEFEREIPDPDGGPARHSLATYIPDVVEGQVRGFYVHVVDISDVKRSHAALAASEARFEKIIALAGEAMISVDAQQTIRIFNTRAERIFGYSAAEMIGRDISDLFPGDILQVQMRDDEAQAPVDTPLTLVARRKSGEEFPAEATMSRFQFGDSAWLTILVRDISTRLRVETECKLLAEAGAVLPASLDYKETLRAIADEVVTHLADLCVVDILSPDGKSLDRLTVSHTSAAKAPLIGELAQLQLDPERTLGRDVFRTGEPQIYEDMTSDFYRSFVHDQEHLRLLQALAPRSALAVPLIHGSLIGALIFGSEHPRRYTAADIPLATELARRAALAIHNARLYEAEQRATRTRDEILGIVAHDLRSPLNSIYLGAQLLQQEVANLASQRADEEVHSIMRSTMWANRLIQDLLDVARIEGGGLTIAKAKVSPGDVIDEVCGMHRLVASSAGITLRTEVADDIAPVWADRARLIQVLENLVGNALKFTTTGGRVTISATNDADFVEFSVSDTGAGIPEANLDRVFDRFWQANRTERRGAGLGLPICKGMIEKHGGRIWGTSSVGYGTTFRFTIPSMRPQV